MTPITVGILGVGHLTHHMVPGLVAGATALRIRLSPRSADRARDLRSRYDLEIAGNNAELVENSNVVLVGVRQFNAVDVVSGLPWRAEQTVISCCAGLALGDIAPHLGGATAVRAMPTIAAEFGESPTCVFPDNDIATTVLSNCGPVIPLASERDFNAATVTVCYSSMLFGLLSRMTEWNERAGLDPATARRLVTELTRSSAALALHRDHVDLDSFLEELATPGSFTLKGLKALRAANAFQPWVDMSNVLMDALCERQDAQDTQHRA